MKDHNIVITDNAGYIFTDTSYTYLLDSLKGCPKDCVNQWVDYVAKRSHAVKIK